MTDRAAAISAFLAQTEFSAASRAPLAGDAGNRRYERLTRADGARAILMDARPDKAENTRVFADYARYLLSIGLSAPRIFAEDYQNGFLLIEDLGDALFARHTPANPDDEWPLYKAAIDVLVALHAHPPPPITQPYAPHMPALARLAYDWYLWGASGEKNPAAAEAFQTEITTALAGTSTGRDVLILRDFHAENLLWLPERDGVARVGLLDFQDAMTGHPSYDIISLAEDARRDVPPEMKEAMIAHYIARTGTDGPAFRRAAAVTAAQRNLRILGVFARLSMHFGKPHYVDFIPRTWDHLMNDLDHPDLGRLREMVRRDLPEPTVPVLERLKSLCGTAPTL